MELIILVAMILYIVVLGFYLYVRYKTYEPNPEDDEEQLEYLKRYNDDRK